MVTIIQELDESIIERSDYDEEIILEVLGMESSRISQSFVPPTSH